VASLTIVECFGVPGVGKTHVASRICQILEAEGISTSDLGILIGKASAFSRVLRKSSLVCRSTAKHPAALKIVFRIVKLHRPRKLRHWLKLMVNWLYVRALIADNSPSAAVRVLDQGIGQALWSTRFYGQEAPNREILIGALTEFLGTLPTIALLIVCIGAPEKVVRERLKQRQDGRSPLDKNEDLWERASQETSATKCVLEYWTCNSSRVSLTDYNNHRSDEALDHKLLSHALESWIAARVSHVG